MQTSYVQRLEDQKLLNSATAECNAHLLGKTAPDSELIQKTQRLLRTKDLQPSGIVLGILEHYRRNGSITYKQREVLASKVAKHSINFI